MGSRKPYPDEFKQEAVQLVTEQGLSASRIARDLGIDPETLRRRLRARTAEVSPPTESLSTAAELARLQRGNEQLPMERDILKKSSASSRGCRNEPKISVRGRAREQLSGHTVVPGAGAGP